MMWSSRGLVLILALSVSAAAGCHLFTPAESRVRAGELFEVAHNKYDPYFQEVHALQQQVVHWTPQKDATRRPLVDALKLDPDVADVTLVQATHERMLGIARDAGTIKLDVTEGRGRVSVQNAAKVDEAGRSVFAAIETCVKNELERAKTLREVPTKADALSKQGRSLEPQVQADLQRRGSRVPKQVQDELHASYEVLAEISKSSRLRAREAEDFVADLRRAVDSDIAESAARPGAAPSGKPAPAKPRSKPETSKPAEAAKPAEPQPKPVETPKPADPKPAEAKPAEAAKPPPAKPKEEFNP